MKRPRYAPVLTLLFAAANVTAHEWNSPPAPDGSVWSGRVWAGPSMGAPAAPAAADCLRAPQPLDLPGPVPVQRIARGDHRLAAAAIADDPVMLRKERAVGESDAARELPSAPSVAPAQAFAEPAVASAAPVTAGVVDDNADFGAYLDFRQRHPNLTVRDRDVSERYLLTVHDAAGRVVPDAEVRLFGAGRALPLWARTDAGGQAWLHPRAAGLGGDVFEVQVSAGGASALVRLQRGQRDALQVTLATDGAPAPARLDLVFLVDATGSMADEIDKLRQSMQAMAAQIAELPSRPSICWGLVAYRDRGDAFFVRAHDFSADLAAFQQGLAALRAGGGGDMPEALNEALHTAVHRLSWRGDGTTRLVLLVADAPPHLDYGAPWYDDDMQGALARGIKLFGIAASGLDRSGEYVMRQLAQYTGGRFVFLTYADAAQPASGPGRETVHDVGNYSVQTLDKLVVRLVREELARRPG